MGIKLDSKGRMLLGKFVETSTGIEIDSSTEVYLSVLKIKEGIFLLLKKDNINGISRKDIDSFLNEYLGKGNYDERFLYNSYTKSVIDKTKRLLLPSKTLINSNKDKSEVRFIVKAYPETKENNVIIFEVKNADNLFKKEKITQITTL